MNKMGAERESTIKRLLRSITAQTNKTLIEGGSDLTNAASKSALLLNDCLDKLERTIELAEELKDESEEESINQILPLENGVT